MTPDTSQKMNTASEAQEAKERRIDQNGNSVESTHLFSRSMQGVASLVLLQVGTRGLTFGLNQILLRYMTPELLAVSIQLELYMMSTLFFARESLRVALQRQTDNRGDGVRQAEGKHVSVGTINSLPCHKRMEAVKSKGSTLPAGYVDADSSAGSTQTVVNLSYISILLGLPLSFLLGKLYLQSASSSTSEIPWFRESVVIYGLAALLELFTEPCFVVSQQKMLYSSRAAAESSSTVIRCVVTCAIAVLSAQRGLALGPLPFAIGQITHAVVLLAVYLYQILPIARKAEFSLSPKRIVSRYFSPIYEDHPLMRKLIFT